MDKWKALSWTLKTEYPKTCVHSLYAEPAQRYAKTLLRQVSEKPGCDDRICTQSGDDTYGTQWYFNRASGAKGGRVQCPWRRCCRPRRFSFIKAIATVHWKSQEGECLSLAVFSFARFSSWYQFFACHAFFPAFWKNRYYIYGSSKRIRSEKSMYKTECHNCHRFSLWYRWQEELKQSTGYIPVAGNNGNIGNSSQ